MPQTQSMLAEEERTNPLFTTPLPSGPQNPPLVPTCRAGRQQPMHTGALKALLPAPATTASTPIIANPPQAGLARLQQTLLLFSNRQPSL